MKVLLDTHTFAWLASEPENLTDAARGAIADDGVDALASTKLPAIHDDPFDRVLVALAAREGLAIVSRDAMVARYPGVRVVW